ncbi:peptidoglycan editing factor PgeF [bacterium]|nr:peptidoglycan editing factor PgeF [bacterium]
MHIFQSIQLASFPWMQHGFGKRTFDEDQLRHSPHHVLKIDQVHGDDIIYVGQNNKDQLFKADAFVTDQPGIICHVRTADCVPILIADVEKKIVAAVHAGWKSSAKQIAAKTIRYMQDKLSCNPEKIIAAIGPCICHYCFEVEDDLLDGFKGGGFDPMPYVEKVKGKYYLDLLGVNLAQMCEEGLVNYDLISECTFENRELNSFRRDKSDTRQVNFIVIL